jgi:hypothetical protein
LDFANTKTLDPRITFTRASGGSYVGADGLIKYAGVNEARFDHDPVTGESLGLLVEEQRTNLVTYSERINFWGPQNATVLTNVDISPDGTLTSDEVVENTAGNLGTFRLVLRPLSATSGTTYTLTIYAKRPPTGSERFLQLTFGSNSFSEVPFANFDLSTGMIPAFGVGNSASSSIESVGNGWYRCRLTATANTTASSSVFILLQQNRNAVRFAGYPGDGTSGIYVWGAQLEAGAFPTSYIPTQASTRTRAVDNASITGKNFSDFFNFNEGTSYVSFKFGPVTSGQRVFVNYFNPQNSVIINQRASAPGTAHVVSFLFPGMSSIINLGISNTSQFTSPFLKANSIFSYKNGDIAYSTGGGIQYTNNTTFLPLNDLSRPAVGVNIGSTPTTLHLNGHISRFTYFPKRLPDQQLRALTR